MCRGKILRAVENPSPRESRPVHTFSFIDIEGSPYGTSLMEEIESSGSLLNGFLRLFIDNARLAALPLIGQDDSGIENPNEAWSPGMRINTANGRPLRDVLSVHVMPDATGPAINGIKLSEDLANSASGIPAYLEGDQTGYKANTATEANHLKESALNQLGIVLQNMDQDLIGPLALDFYDWNMLNSDDIDIKGDFTVEATGFQSFQNEAILANVLNDLFAMATSDPDAAKIIKKDEVIREKILISSGSDVSRFMRTKQEVEELRGQESKSIQEQQNQATQLTEQERILEAKKLESDVKIALEKIKLAQAQLENGTKQSEEERKNKILLKGMELESREGGGDGSI